MAAPRAGAGHTGAAKVGDLFDAIEPLRRRLHVSGAFLVTAGVLSIFLTWDVPGAVLAIAAGSIACDVFSSPVRARGRLSGSLHACGGRGCCGSTDPMCGAPSHMSGLLIALFVFAGIFEVASILYVWTQARMYAWACDGYTDAAYRDACPNGAGTLAPEVFPMWNGSAYVPTTEQVPSQRCGQWAYCVSQRYDYVISAASIALHIALFIAGGIAFSTLTALRAAVAGTSAAVLVGPPPCGGPSSSGGGGGVPMSVLGEGAAPMQQQHQQQHVSGDGPALTRPPDSADPMLPYPQQRMGGVAV